MSSNTENPTPRMSLVEAVEYIRNDEAHIAALAGLSEVREVLDGLAVRYKNGERQAWCWCAIPQFDSTKPHSVDCNRAAALYDKLAVR